MTRTSEIVRRLAAGGALAAMMAGCATAPVATGRRTEVPFPSPLSGPGHPHATETARRRIDRGWREILSGRFEAARHEALKAGNNAAARLLILQTRVLEEPRSAMEGLRSLTEASPDYAAAWITLSAAAERTDHEALALRAARRAASLWRSARWLQRVTALEDRWIGSRLAGAQRAIEAGDWKVAARLAAAAGAVDPGNRRATLLLARAQMELGDEAAAGKELATLGDDPAAILLEGTMAERHEDWTRALELYQRLPDTDPAKGPALERVKRRWRIANLPEYVQKALGSERLTRSDLAVLVANLLPQLLALPARDVPVISDIVDLPSRKEIVTVVAAGLMRADPIEHTFDPGGHVTAAQARRVLDRAIELTGRTAPAWCQAGEPVRGCFELSDPPTGRQVAAVLMAMEEVPPHE